MTEAVKSRSRERGSLPGIVLALGLALACVSAGCAIQAPATPRLATVKELPVFALLYYPLGPSLVRGIAVPVPDYQSWPDERMERDIGRLRETGVDAIILAMDMAVLRDAAIRERYAHFLSLCVAANAATRVPPPLRLVFGLYGDADRAADFPFFVQWFFSFPADLRQQMMFGADNRPLLLLAPDLAQALERHPAFRCQIAPGDGLGTVRLLEQRGAPLPVAPDAVCTIHAGLLAETTGSGGGKRDWLLPRRNGKTLRRALAAGAVAGPRLVCIASWNNYAEGSFVEPNTLDGRHTCAALKREIGVLRQEVTGPP